MALTAAAVFDNIAREYRLLSRLYSVISRHFPCFDNKIKYNYSNVILFSMKLTK